MPNYSDHNEVLKLLEDCQSVEQDNRSIVHESHLFVTKENGQWEPEFYSRLDGKPRYTFDQTSPIIDMITGQIEQSDFGVDVAPANGEASEENAELLSGVIRGIENLSGASNTYSAISRNIVTGGFDAIHLKTDYYDDESFDQDIIIERVYNSWDRVWFDSGALDQDKSDAEYAFLLSTIPMQEFKERFPDRSGSSLSQSDTYQTYFNKAEVVIVGHIYYAEYKDRELQMLSNGKVVWADEIESIADDMAAQGIVVERTRTVKDRHIKLRKFDGQGWIDDEQETVWSRVPLIPFYANYKVIENKAVYHGFVLKAMDPQRVLNYSLSREIEEGALAPRRKLMMTKTQAQGHQKSLATLNTNADPVQFYNADAEATPPFETGGASINAGLRVISDGMFNMMRSVSGQFDASMGDSPNAQSGVAIDKLQSRSNNMASKYFRSIEIGIEAAAKAIVKAIPNVYDAQRRVRIAGADGKTEMAVINEAVQDAQTGEVVIVNDLSKGKYDVTVSAAPKFDSRQSETVSSLIEIAKVNPAILQIASDVLTRNINAPEMDLVADRMRRQLINAGAIPQSQLTDEEQAEIMQAQMLAQQQSAQPDAASLIAQAEMQKAQNELQKTQLQAMAQQQKNQIDAAKLDLEAQKLSLESQRQEIAFMEMQQKAGLEVDAQQFDQAVRSFEMQQAAINDSVANIKTQTDSLAQLFKATGADAVMSPAAAAAYSNIAQNIAIETQ